MHTERHALRVGASLRVQGNPHAATEATRPAVAAGRWPTAER